MRQYTKSISLWLCICLIVTIVFNGITINVKGAGDDDFDTLMAKWVGNKNYDIGDPNIAARLNAINTNAQRNWDKLNKAADRTYLFSDATNKDLSPQVTKSYTNLESMASAYATAGCALYKNEALKNDILSSLRWLYDNGWYDDKKDEGKQSNENNWWDFEIGAPQGLVDAMGYMHADLSSKDLSDYIRTIDHFMLDMTKCYFGQQISTGANRVWIITYEAKIAILEKNKDRLAAARDACDSLFDYVTTSDGFYVDGSFIQHDDQPYTGGYGSALLQKLFLLMDLFSGSPWEINTQKSRNIFKWIYDSYEPLIYKNRIFDNVRGRNIARVGETSMTVVHGFIRALVTAIDLAPPADAARIKSMIKYYVESDSADFFSNMSNSAEIISKVEKIMADSSIEPRGDISIYKHYNSMDRTSLLRPGYGFGIGMFSNRIQNYENMNNEDTKGWHTADGFTQLFDADTSQFLDAFWPTVDSYRLPGTTVEQSTEVANNARSSTPNVGGTDIDSEYGVTGMEIRTPGQTLSARKAWFMFDNEIVCLGAGISANDDKNVETIVENHKLKESADNALTVDGAAKPTTPGWSETMSGVKWAHLEGNVDGSDIGYYFPEGATLKGLREARTGAWSDIGNGASTAYTRNYLTMWMDHGNNPTDSSYAYTLLPGFGREQVQNYTNSPETQVLENSDDVQAVKDTGNNIIGAIFWNNQSKSIEAGTSDSDIITCDSTAAVMTKQTGSELSISVSDITQQNAGTITLEISKHADSVLAADPGVNVIQLGPTIKLTVDVNESKGKSFKIKLALSNAAMFSDIENHWGRDTIEQLVNRSIVNGYSDGTFKPDANIATDEFIKILVTALGAKVISGSDYWASTYIDEAKKLGLIKEGEFKDYTKNINRAEMAGLIARAIKDNPLIDKEKYKSVIADFNSIPAEYKDYVVKAYDFKIITGDEDGNFKSGTNATRAEAAAMITRLLKSGKAINIPAPVPVPKEKPKPSTGNLTIDRLVEFKVIDNPDYWLQNAVVGKTCDGPEVAKLLISAMNKIKPVTTMEEAMAVMQEENITTSTYWSDYTKPGKTCKGDYLAPLLTKITDRLLMIPNIASSTSQTSVSAAKPAVQINVLTNPGFENGDKGWDITTGWAVSGDEKRTGVNAMSLIGTGTFNKIKQKFTVKADTNYTFSFYGKCSTNNLIYKVQDANLRFITSDMRVEGNNTWTKYSVTFNSGKNTTMWIYIAGDQGTHYIDDIGVSQTQE